MTGEGVQADPIMWVSPGGGFTPAPRPAGPRTPHTAGCLVIGDGLRPGGRGAPAGQGGGMFVGRRRGVGLTTRHRLISNQFQSGGCEATNVGAPRCREARPLVLDPGRAHGPLFAMMPPDPARDDWDVMCPAGLAACGGTRVSAEAGEAPG